MVQACIYLRLSKDDGDTDESNSIINQRTLLHNYAKTHGIEIREEFVDDGISGLTFNRPAFRRMMTEVGNKTIDTIIVKDSSRFGRDYIETGRYIQRLFPAMGVRFISVNDHYDSQTADANETHLVMPIKSLINDSYCRDISIKVRSTQKTKRLKGEFIGAFAPFGYQKDSYQRNHLVVDEPVRHIIEKIFRRKLEGYSSKAIADFLNQAGLETPLKRKKAANENFKGFNGWNNRWDAKMVNRVLTDRVYTGCLEQGKRTKLNYKSQKTIQVNPEDWVRVEDTHEGIISEDTFEIANTLLLRDVKQGKETPNIFAGLLFCGDCQSQMIRRKSRYKQSVTLSYICSTYNNGRGCSRHTIKHDDLLKVVATLLHKHLDWTSHLIQNLPDDLKQEQFLEIDFTDLMSNRQKYEQLIQSLYMDLDDGLINETEYQEFLGHYRRQLKQVEQTIVQKQQVAQDLYHKLRQREEWLKNISSLQEESQLTRLTLVTLIDRIDLYENQELTLVFHNLEEVSILQTLAQTRREVV